MPCRFREVKLSRGPDFKKDQNQIDAEDSNPKTVALAISI